MRLIGTMSPEKNDNGMYTLTIKDLPIPISGVSPKYAGERINVLGKLMWSRTKGSYFKAGRCWATTKPDKSSAEVEGDIIAIYPERLNSRGRRSACVILQQSDSDTSTVLVTALSAGVDRLLTDNLSIGQHIRIRGNISYHNKGLHVLYVDTLNKEDTTDVGEIQEPEGVC